MEVIYLYLPGGTENNHETLQQRQPMPWPRFGPTTSGIKVKRVTAEPSCLENVGCSLHNILSESTFRVNAHTRV
jgi:hypothetical protein